MEAMSAVSDVSIIGQVGVGFYSACFLFRARFLWSARPTTINNTSGSRHWANLSSCRKTRKWSMERSKIIFHINEDQSDFREERRLKDLVNKHSGFTGFPIEL